MICKCDSVVLRKKKFSDFEFIDPSTKDEADKIFLAGYIVDDKGEKQNVRVLGSSFINAKFGVVVPTLDGNNDSKNVTIVNDIFEEKPVKVAVINYDNNVEFIQINKVTPDMYFTIDGKEYLLIKLSSNVPLGTVFRIYIPNFPFDKGVLLFPSSDEEITNDTPVEVLYNPLVEDHTEIDFYFSLIQLADTEKEDVTLKTRVLCVLNVRVD